MIRQAHIDDEDALLHIWLQRPGAPTDPSQAESDAYRAAFRRALLEQSETFRIWAFEQERTEAPGDRQVVGWLSLLPMRNNPAVVSSMAEISFYVEPHAQRKGIGAALIKAALAHARSTPLEWILGFVGETSVASQALLSNYGFRIQGELPAPSRNRGRPRIFILACEVTDTASDEGENQ